MLKRGDTIVGKYCLEERLGHGGFGEVWKAQDLLADRIVAIKAVVTAEDRPVVLLLDEAKVWSKLKHPNIVEFITAEREPDDSAVYFVMEFMEEGSLAQALKRYGPLSPQRVESVALDVLSALEYTHEQAPSAPILHRDIKPENLFFTKEGRVKVGDWGLARRIREGGGQMSEVGTWAYMAPEIFRREKYDHRVDLYALGVTLYELLKGEPPFMESEERKPEIPGGWPKALRGVIARSLVKRPEERFTSAAEMRKALTDEERTKRVLPGKGALASDPRLTGAKLPSDPEHAASYVRNAEFYGWIENPNPTERYYWGGIGRNTPCPCGSGRKYKKCHGAA